MNREKQDKLMDDFFDLLKEIKKSPNSSFDIKEYEGNINKIIDIMKKFHDAKILEKLKAIEKNLNGVLDILEGKFLNRDKSFYELIEVGRISDERTQKILEIKKNDIRDVLRMTKERISDFTENPNEQHNQIEKHPKGYGEAFGYFCSIHYELNLKDKEEIKEIFKEKLKGKKPTKVDICNLVCDTLKVVFKNTYTTTYGLYPTYPDLIEKHILDKLDDPIEKDRILNHLKDKKEALEQTKETLEQNKKNKEASKQNSDK